MTRHAYCVAREGREWFAVLDPIAASEAGINGTVLDGYTTHRAAEDAARLMLGLDTCRVCEHRRTTYGTGPCDAHNGDVWPTRKDN